MLRHSLLAACTRLGPGISAALAVAIVATFVGRFVPLAGAPIVAIVLGIVVGAMVPIPPALRPGLRFTARTLLQASIVVLGLGLSLGTLARVGAETFPVMIGTLVICLIAAPFLGRALRLSNGLWQLIGFGTAICGASAIAALSGVIDASDAEIASAIGTVFAFNILGVLTFPPIGHALGMNAQTFGVWAGTAINDTSSVVAAGYAYDPSAGATATVVKLTRATMILPIVAAAAIVVARRRHAKGERIAWSRVVPWFIVWFVVASIVATLGLVPSSWHAAIGLLGVFGITLALAAIGINADLAQMRRAGLRPLVDGGLLWILVAITSLALQRAFGLG